MVRFLTFLFSALVVGTCCWAEGVSGSSDEPREFVVMTYNVENLFDVDRTAAFDDYVEIPEDPNSYGPSKLMGKLRGIGKVLQSIQKGKGPEVLVLNEIEIDFTPESTVANYPEFLAKYADTTAEKMLTGNPSDELRGLPAEAWLLKHLQDIGLTGYHLAVGADSPEPQEDERKRKAQKNVVLSRWPILEFKSHPVEKARFILEVRLDVDGRPLTILVNHWKSGAKNPAEENVRLGNAAVLRKRLNEILGADASAEVILAGDFNSHYNQGQRYPFMTKTAIQDVLGSQGDKAAMGKADGPILFNLWYDCAPDQRYSDEYGGEWGTLMQALVTRGLLDGQGIEYVDGSFGQVFVDGVNRQPPFGTPWRWTNFGTGFGTSDHFPVAARFRILKNPEARPLSNPPGGVQSPKEPLKLDFHKLDRSKLRNAAVLKDATIEDFAKAMGEIFVVEATFSKIRPLEVEVDGKSYSLHSFDKDLKKALGNEPRGKRMKFLGELGMHKGKLQFVVHDPSWIQ